MNAAPLNRPRAPHENSHATRTLQTTVHEAGCATVRSDDVLLDRQQLDGTVSALVIGALLLPPAIALWGGAQFVLEQVRSRRQRAKRIVASSGETEDAAAAEGDSALPTATVTSTEVEAAMRDSGTEDTASEAHDTAHKANDRRWSENTQV